MMEKAGRQRNWLKQSGSIESGCGSCETCTKTKTYSQNEQEFQGSPGSTIQLPELTIHSGYHDDGQTNKTFFIKILTQRRGCV